MSQKASYNSLEQRIQELEHENATLKQEIAAVQKFKATDCFDSAPGEYEGAINQKFEKESQLLLTAVEQNSENGLYYKL